MFDPDKLIVKTYWLLRKLTCYNLVAENAIILKDTTTLYLNLILYYYQIANKTIYTSIEKNLFYEKNIKRYEYVFLVWGKIQPFLKNKRRSFSSFLKFYDKKIKVKLNTDKLSTIWETYETPIDQLTIEQMVKINDN